MKCKIIDFIKKSKFGHLNKNKDYKEKIEILTESLDKNILIKDNESHRNHHLLQQRSSDKKDN